MLRLLLIDDNEHDRALIVYKLKSEFPDVEVEQVTKAEDFHQALEAGNFEFVITDYRVRWSDGVALLQDIKSRYPKCPVIMFTDSGTQEIAVEAMKAGLDDYIIKSAKHYVRLPVAVRSILQRLEQQERAERALQEANQRCADILESVTDAFCALDQQFRFTYVNRKSEQILLKTQAELLGKNIWEEYPQAVGSVFYQKYYEAATTKLPVQFEAFCPHLNMWLEVRVYPREDGLTIYSHDISDRKRLESEREQFLAREQAARAEAEAQERRSTFLGEASRLLASSLDYRTTLASVASIAVPTLADWCFVDIIEKNLTVFNDPIIVASDPEKEALIRELRQRYPPPVDADFGAPKVLRTGQPEMATEIPDSLVLSIAQDARHLSLMRQLNAQSYMVVPLIAGKRKLGTIAFVLASERRYQKADLAMATELAQRAAIAIDNAMLYREAWEANRIKDEFLAIVSHELRTPLNSMLGWAKLLRQGKLNQATAAKALETIERNAELQKKLIEDILDVSRIVQGKIRLNLRPLHLIRVIDAVSESIRPIAQAKAIQFQSLLDPNVAQVTGDADRLQQVLWNLLSNAVKFTPSGGCIEIRLEQVNSMAQITVSDTGAGISADFLPYVFERFRQADGTSTRANGGLGLGLAIVRHLVEMHNGTVYATSDGEGLGATFTVQLPIRTEEQIVQPTNLDSVASSEFPSLNGLRILLVDDNTDTLGLISFILEQYQAQVTTVTSASEALAALSQFKPNVLISDIGMPGEDGYSLIQKIRSLPAKLGGYIPAAALTAFAGEAERNRALTAGFQIHISKPVEPAELVAAVVKLAEANGQV
ncbi:response regulator [Tolypothrix campylonemoides VB511288]|nr:response regulator [Tolypothrix campylonemoides VB511288]